jgi:hypothetical protein
MTRDRDQLLDKFTLTVKTGEFSFQNKYGLVEVNGKEILEPIYHAIWEIARGLIGYRYGIVFGLINENGEILIEPRLEGYREFDFKGRPSCSFAEDLYGPHSYEPDYEYITYYEIDTHRPLLLDFSGKIISRFEFDWIGRVFRAGNSKVLVNGKAGIYNFKLDKYEVEPTYQDEELYLSENGEIIYVPGSPNRMG